jgi:hypothetical protein
MARLDSRLSPETGMPVSRNHLFKNCVEFVPIDQIRHVIPRSTRGVYVLYYSPDGEEMKVVYIGMSRGEKYGVGGRLERHKKEKLQKWTHFSVYEVWDNITKTQVEELEGLFLHVYAKDFSPISMNVHKTSALISGIHRSPGKWLKTDLADVRVSKTSRKRVAEKNSQNAPDD